MLGKRKIMTEISCETVRCLIQKGFNSRAYLSDSIVRKSLLYWLGESVFGFILGLRDGIYLSCPMELLGI